MGEQNVKLNSDEATSQAFMKSLLVEVHALERMLEAVTLAGNADMVRREITELWELAEEVQELAARARDRKLSPADMQGEILGLGQSGLALARILGPAIGLALFAVTPETPYWISAAIMAVALLASFSLLRSPPAEPI